MHAMCATAPYSFMCVPACASNGFSAAHRAIVREADYLALLRALAAAKGAPPDLGLCEPHSLEANIMQITDRLSAQSELSGEHAPSGSGFGRYHPYRVTRPFVLWLTV